MGNTSSTVGDTLATAGKVRSTMGLVAGGVIGGIMLLIAVYLLSRHHKYTHTVQGTVGKASCSQSSKYRNGRAYMEYDCSLTITYTVNGKPYTISLSTDSSHSYSVGNTVSLQYNSSDPSDARITQLSDQTISLLLLGLAVLIVGGAYLSFWGTRHSRTYAQYEGIGMIRNVL